jgi:hypothetical protein
MTYLRHKYCQSAFKAILLVIGLTFFVAQASFKFYQFASFPFGESFTRAISHGSIAGRTKDFLNYNKQAKISLVLDKRYDFKHVFISPAPLRCTNKSGQSICLTSQRNDWKKHEKDTEKV